MSEEDDLISRGEAMATLIIAAALADPQGVISDENDPEYIKLVELRDHFGRAAEAIRALPTAHRGVAEEVHPEDVCQRCHGSNVTWFAPSPLWNLVVRSKGEPEILCPICFILLAEEAGINNQAWKVAPEFYDGPAPPERVAESTADARVAEAVAKTWEKAIDIAMEIDTNAPDWKAQIVAAFESGCCFEGR